MFVKMRRVTKNLCIFIFGLLFTVFYCEFLIYYVVIAQCNWPAIETKVNEDPLKAFILSDTHLLGPRKGHWLDKFRREWQMHRAFQTIIALHKPEVIFLLGDLFDEGEWSNEKQFNDYVERFYRLFHVPKDIKMFIVVGNHDIGFHNYIRMGAAQRFSKALNSSSVQFVTLKGNHFVLINSMAMEGDRCSMCVEARRRIDNVANKLLCSQNSSYCVGKIKPVVYSRPILMQHFPLYRASDEICTEPDAPPLPERNKKFRIRIDALSKEATEYLIAKIKPRAVFGGHTHHGCLVNHTRKLDEDVSFYEYSVPSFSWRNRPDPKYMLVTITPNNYAVMKCGLPLETTIVFTAGFLLLVVACYFPTWKSLRK